VCGNKEVIKAAVLVSCTQEEDVKSTPGLKQAAAQEEEDSASEASPAAFSPLPLRSFGLLARPHHLADALTGIPRHCRPAQ
jgi:hypothetical protein